MPPFSLLLKVAHPLTRSSSWLHLLTLRNELIIKIPPHKLTKKIIQRYITKLAQFVCLLKHHHHHRRRDRNITPIFWSASARKRVGQVHGWRVVKRPQLVALGIANQTGTQERKKSTHTTSARFNSKWIGVCGCAAIGSTNTQVSCAQPLWCECHCNLVFAIYAFRLMWFPLFFGGVYIYVRDLPARYLRLTICLFCRNSLLSEQYCWRQGRFPDSAQPIFPHLRWIFISRCIGLHAIFVAASHCYVCSVYACGG